MYGHFLDIQQECDKVFNFYQKSIIRWQNIATYPRSWWLTGGPWAIRKDRDYLESKGFMALHHF